MTLFRKRFEIAVYDCVVILNTFKEKGIKLYNFQKVGEYNYRFSLNKKDVSIFEKEFSNYKHINTSGLLAIVFNIAKKRLTILALILTIVTFSFFTTRMYIITVTGDSSTIIPLVYEELDNLGVHFFASNKSQQELKNIENNLLINLKDYIEYVEVKQVGSTVQVRFQKRRIAPDLPQERGSLYASKDGIIKSFNIKKGMKVVRELQFVRKGDLLVDENLLTTSGELIHIGTEGNVLAYTWQSLELFVDKEEKFDYVDAFSYLLDEAHYQIGKELTTDEEYIESENVVYFNQFESYYVLKIHFILVEDITIE